MPNSKLTKHEQLAAIKQQGSASVGNVSALTHGEQLAVEAIIADPRMTKTQAMLVGYPQRKKWKRCSLDSAAVRLFDHPRVIAEMSRLYNKRRGKILKLHDQVLEEFKQLAFATLPDLVDYKAGMIRVNDFSHLTPAQRACIKKFRCTTATQIVDRKPVPVSVIEIELHDKIAALNAIAKIQGMFIQKIEISNSSAADPTQVLARVIELALPEEREVLQRMAERLAKQLAQDNQQQRPPPRGAEYEQEAIDIEPL